MEPSFQITQDSRSLMQFFKPTKKEIIKQKKERKLVQESNRIRKNSTQLSLAGWLVKNRIKQNCAMAHLQKSLIVNIYSYLRISQIICISQTCYYLYQCAKSIWNDSDFFRELQTDKLSHAQLKKIFEKGGKMSHIKQLKNIYLGKNLRLCRQKIKLKIKETTSHSLKPMNGILLQIFEVSTKVHKSSAFLMDSHLQQIINSSFRSLLTVKLQSCRYIRKFSELSKCTKITTLFITQNSYFSNEDLRVITKNCSKIQHLNLAYCDNLDQGIFKYISKLIFLKVLILNSYQQPFGDLQCMKPLTNLYQISIQNSCMMDSEGLGLIRQLQSLAVFNVSGCQLLTDYFIHSIVSMTRQQKIQLKMDRTKFSQQALQCWFNINQKDKEDRNLIHPS